MSAYLGEARILVVGGEDRESDGEIYYPTSQRVSSFYKLRVPRCFHAAATTNSGRTLLSGGVPKGTASGCQLLLCGLELPFGCPRRLASATFSDGIDEWDAPALPYERLGHGSASIDEAVYVMGGWESLSPLHRCMSHLGHRLCNRPTPASFSCIALLDQGETWTRISSMETGRAAFATVAAPNASGEQNIFAIGGMQGSPWSTGEVYRTVEVYNAESDRWTTTTPMPQPLMNHAGAYCDGKIYICGGISQRNVQLSVYSLDVRVGQWEEETPMQDQRFAHCVASINGVMYALGGNDYQGRPLKSVDCYDPRSKEWNSGKPLNLPAVFSTATPIVS